MVKGTAGARARLRQPCGPACARSGCLWSRRASRLAGTSGNRKARHAVSVAQRPRCSVVIMAVATRFTELVGCRVPIQQAPMGSVSTPALAVAVADAGGGGSITTLGLTAAELDKLLDGLAARTTGVL